MSIGEFAVLTHLFGVHLWIRPVDESEEALFSQKQSSVSLCGNQAQIQANLVDVIVGKSSLLVDVVTLLKCHARQ